MLITDSNDDYVSRHQAQRSAGDADQAEFGALRNTRANVYEGIYDDLVADALDDFDPQDAQAEPESPEWSVRDLQYDDAFGAVLEKIEERVELLGRDYPFRVDDNALTYVSSKTKVYEFCLCICEASLDRGQNSTLARTFEQVARLVVQDYLGQSALSHHTGWPRDDKAQKRFKAAMQVLGSRTNEWCWGPEDGLPNDPDPTNVKDEGVDFVVWRPNPDRRAGSLFLLGQCACGQNWDSKFDDININKLSKWFNPMTLVDPVRVFCTPHHVTNGMIRETSREAGVVFDRIRLAILAENSSQEIRSQLMSLDLGQYLP